MPASAGDRARDGAWTEPATELVGEGVYRIPLPLPGDGLRAVNVYAIVHPAGVTLVDSGWSFGPGLEVLATALAGLDRELGDIDQVLTTHVHRDHYTLAIRLRQRFGTRVLLGVGERETLAAVMSDSETDRYPLLTRWGADEVSHRLHQLPPRPESLFEQPDEWLAGGARVNLGQRTLRVIATPGHTKGHLVFIDEDNGFLFAGDHVLPRITPSIGVEFPRSALPLGDYLQSLALVRQLPDLMLLPAHGPLGWRSHERVDELLVHHRQRLEAAASAVRAGHQTVYDVARALPWTRHDRHFRELDVENQLLAVAETAAHLDVLARDGCVTKHEVDGVDHHSPTAGVARAHTDE